MTGFIAICTRTEDQSSLCSSCMIRRKLMTSHFISGLWVLQRKFHCFFLLNQYMTGNSSVLAMEYDFITDLVQDHGNFSASAIEWPQSCAEPAIFINWTRISRGNIDNVFKFSIICYRYRDFPLVRKSDIEVDSEREYTCNFLGTIYANTSREQLLKLIHSQKLEKKHCLVKARMK